MGSQMYLLQKANIQRLKIKILTFIYGSEHKRIREAEKFFELNRK